MTSYTKYTPYTPYTQYMGMAAPVNPYQQFDPSAAPGLNNQLAAPFGALAPPGLPPQMPQAAVPQDQAEPTPLPPPNKQPTELAMREGANRRAAGQAVNADNQLNELKLRMMGRGIGAGSPIYRALKGGY